MRKLLVLLCCFMAVTALPARKKTTNAHIPILGWYSIPPGESATLENYQEMRDAGFDYSFSTDIKNFEDAVQVLDLCALVGMKAVFTSPELKTEPEETVRKVMKHPGLGMYFLRDEPRNEDFDELGEWARRIKNVDSAHPCYLNLISSEVFKTSNDYANHLRLFTEKVNLPQLSFDHYPITEKDGVVSTKAVWYQSLELISAEARRSNKPFWAFALAASHSLGAQWRYPIPTIEHLRLQMYSNLAYGAQLLQYYGYWKYYINRYFSAPIMLDGRRTGEYELVREMNQEIQQRAFVWAGCNVEGVYHLGDSIPLDTKPLTALPAHFRMLQNEKGHGLVSLIHNGNRHYVMLVNTSPTEPWHVNVETDENVKLVRRDGSIVQNILYTPLRIISPGDCLIFEI